VERRALLDSAEPHVVAESRFAVERHCGRRVLTLLLRPLLLLRQRRPHRAAMSDFGAGSAGLRARRRGCRQGGRSLAAAAREPQRSAAAVRAAPWLTLARPRDPPNAAAVCGALAPRATQTQADAAARRPAAERAQVQSAQPGGRRYVARPPGARAQHAARAPDAARVPRAGQVPRAGRVPRARRVLRAQRAAPVLLLACSVALPWSLPLRRRR
jgi:hypothetical protein